MNMIIQTCAIQSDIARQFTIAGTKLINLIDQFDRILDRSGTRIWSEIPRLILFYLTRKKHTRKIFPHRYADIRIGLVIAQHGIVFRRVFLDQIAFQYQSLQLGVRNNVLKSRNMFHHLFLLDSLIVARLKILPHAFSQTYRLSDIDDGICFIMHNINSRLIREFT